MKDMEYIAAASAAIGLVDKLLTVIEERRAKGGKEWTAEEEAAFDKLVEDRMKMAHWKPSGRTS